MLPYRPVEPGTVIRPPWSYPRLHRRADLCRGAVIGLNNALLKRLGDSFHGVISSRAAKASGGAEFTLSPSLDKWLLLQAGRERLQCGANKEQRLHAPGRKTYPVSANGRKAKQASLEPDSEPC